MAQGLRTSGLDFIQVTAPPGARSFLQRSLVVLYELGARVQRRWVFRGRGSDPRQGRLNGKFNFMDLLMKLLTLFHETRLHRLFSS